MGLHGLCCSSGGCWTSDKHRSNAEMSSLAADLPLGIRPGQSCHYDPELVRVRNWDQGQVIVLLCRGQYTWRHPPTSPLRSASKWPMRSVPKRPIKYVSNIIQVANEVRIQVADGYPGGHLSPTGTQVCSSCSLSPARVEVHCSSYVPLCTG